ncbi:MAG: ammonium transporter [Oscillospiraceae bacterium]|nr:ammonium transporter [Oscillospiraceae bacterium]
MSEELMTSIGETVTAEAFGIWFLIGAALVFFMQAGFAMVETGFTRAKNAGNIIMKNLMDFCIGTVMFILIGFGLLMGEDMAGLIGKPGFDIFTAYESFDFSTFVFNLVFCATTATIVSGAMAERTKFLSYCVYSAVISGLIYPIEAHWIWGGGWLSQMGFHDFAGSCAIHMVGGISALIGAKLLGPRIGKFEMDKDGKVTKVKAIPGHSLTIGALGCFILWFGWYGFNGAAATSGPQLGSIFLTTTVAPAVATFVCMVFTWLKYGKPDVSMCLNASLAGLVGITSGCDVLDCFGAIMVGIVSGLLVPFGVWLLDYKLHIDDPVGAVAVHCLNGIWGTIAVGLFANPATPAYSIANDSGTLAGVCYGGGGTLIGLQLLGMVSVMAWTTVTITITFLVIKAVFGLRVSPHEEVVGLDIEEHGIESSYSGFVMAIDPEDYAAAGEPVPAEAAVPVTAYKPSKPAETPANDGMKYSQISVICKQNRLETLKKAMADVGVTGITVTQVLGCGTQKGASEYYRGTPVEPSLLPKVKVDMVVCKVPVNTVIDTARKALYTGHIGDGKIFVYNVEDIVRVRTGEIGFDALQDSEG